MDNIINIDNVFNEYRSRYVNIFRKLYPAKGSTGFQERNLTVNFASSYEKLAEKQGNDCIVWYEFQFGKKSNEHLDAIIIDRTSKQIFLIEAKRFKSNRKIESIGKDIRRITELKEELKNDSLNERISDIEHFNFIGIILADTWIGRPLRTGIYNSFVANNFIKEYSDALGNINIIPKYNIIEFSQNDGIKYDVIVDEYKLLNLYWKL